MCCKWHAENTGRKKSPKIWRLGTIAQLCRAISSQLRHASTIGKKLVKQQYPLHMFSQYGELRPIITYQLRSVYQFGEPQQISTGFTSCLRYCSDTAQQTSTKLCTMFARLLAWYSIYTFLGAPAPTEFCPAQNSLYVEVLCSLILAALLHDTPGAASAKLYDVVQGMELQNFRRVPPIFVWAAITLGIGPHSSYKYISGFYIFLFLTT